MDYVDSRYYDPEIGRWISADETSYLGINGTVTSYNLYAYCLNNPINAADNGGKFPQVIIQFGIGVLIGGGFELGAQLFTNGGDFSAVNWKQVGIASLTGGVTAVCGPEWSAFFSGVGNARLESTDPNHTKGSVARAFGIGVASSLVGTEAEYLLKQGGGKAVVNCISNKGGLPTMVIDKGQTKLPSLVTSQAVKTAANTYAAGISGIGLSALMGGRRNYES